MKFCPQCGAQLPDEAQFCNNCGTPLAPPVEAPMPQAPYTGNGYAPNTGGEFIPNTGNEYAPNMGEAPYAPAGWDMPNPQMKKPKEKKSFLDRFRLYSGILLTIVALVSAAFTIKQLFFSGDKSDTQQKPQQEVPTTNNPDSPQGEDPDIPQTEDPDIFQGDDSDIPQSYPAISGQDTQTEDDGFQNFDDLTPQAKAEVIESLLERSEAELAEELHKGSAADLSKIRELRENIAALHEKLEQLQP